ncbi:hypothetical protein, partial [Bradyrhizobium sp.]|uniref:hypothetical protein n=1 Tax=Bradyrhizobium sp. TaxID=376 RepID=UPI003C726ED4
VQPLREKFSAFLVGQITFTNSPRPASTRGAARDRHETRGGMRWTLMAPLTNGAIADGEVVWS